MKLIPRGVLAVYKPTTNVGGDLNPKFSGCVPVGVSTTVTTGATSATQVLGSTTGISAGMTLYFAGGHESAVVSSVTNGTTVVLATSITTTLGEAVISLVKGNIHRGSRGSKEDASALGRDPQLSSEAYFDIAAAPYLAADYLILSGSDPVYRIIGRPAVRNTLASTAHVKCLLEALDYRPDGCPATGP